MSVSPEQGVVLRDVRAEDLPVLFDQQRDPEAAKLATFAPRDRDAFMSHWTKILADESIVAMAIVSSRRVAGHIVSWGKEGDREVGYWLGREFWGKGIATDALSTFLGVVTARPMHAHVAKNNVRSARVLEKCGFTLSGESIDGDVEEFVYELATDDA